MSAPRNAPRSALAVGAHPDDIEFGCGATLASWARAGTEVQLLVLTDGSKGSWDTDVDPRALAADREVEQRAAADALGAGALHFLRRVDGELVAGMTEREEVCRVVRRVRPEVVLGHDPWKRYRLHPDHREAGRLVIEGLVAARDPHFYPAQPDPAHRPARLLLFEAEVVDHREPLTERDVRAKLDALACHRSQWRSTMRIEADSEHAGAQRASFEARVRAELREAGAPLGVPAEAFKLLTEL